MEIAVPGMHWALASAADLDLAYKFDPILEATARELLRQEPAVNIGERLAQLWKTQTRGAFSVFAGQELLGCFVCDQQLPLVVHMGALLNLKAPLAFDALRLGLGVVFATGATEVRFLGFPDDPRLTLAQTLGGRIECVYRGEAQRDGHPADVFSVGVQLADFVKLEAQGERPN